MPTILQVHDEQTVYIADTDMISKYLTNEIPAWTSVVCEIIKRGKCVHVLPRCVHEFSKSPYQTLPNGFVEMVPTENKEQSITNAHKDLIAMLNVPKESLKKVAINDILMLLEAGWFAADTLDLDVVLSGKVFLVTNNVKLVEEMLKDFKRRTVIEDAINLNGLEHLIQVRKCSSTSGEIEDFII